MVTFSFYTTVCIYITLHTYLRICWSSRHFVSCAHVQPATCTSTLLASWDPREDFDFSDLKNCSLACRKVPSFPCDRWTQACMGLLGFAWVCLGLLLHVQMQHFLRCFCVFCSPHCRVGFLFFLLHLLAPPPPRSSAFLLPPPSSFLLLSTTSLTQHPTHNISHNNITHTTSLTQHPTHNITHTTSHTQHLSQQHLSQQHLTHNITHTTSHTQHHSHNISNTPAACQGVGCQGVGCTPWRRLASAGHRRRFRGRRSTLLLAKGSDVRPGVVWRRLGTGADFVAGAALCCLPRGRMYALASSGVGWAPAQISWQAQHFAACPRVGCTPWRRLAAAGHRRRFRGRRSTLLLAKGSDVRPGVVWRWLGTGADFVAGAALCCLPRGRMYALASSGVGWAPAQISWQAQHFAACQGVGCTPWRRLASAGHRRRFRGRRSTLLLAKGSDVRPGVVWRRLGTGADFVAGAALCCLPRGRMYALASSGDGWAPAQISWQAQHFAACQGVGCTPWRRLASAGHRRRFRGRRCQGVGCAPA